MSESVDIGKIRKAAHERAQAQQEAVARPTEREPVPRQLVFPVTLVNVFDGSELARFELTSRVMDGPEKAYEARLAPSFAAFPMERLTKEKRQWFESLATCEVQIRDAVGTGIVGETAEIRKGQFMAKLWEDPELLIAVTERCDQHEVRFRVGNPAKGEAKAKFARVVVPPLEPAREA